MSALYDRPEIYLSAQKVNIVKMMAEGMSDKEIAFKMKLSPHTIQTHVKLILANLNARTRAHAVAQAIRLGIID